MIRKAELGDISRIAEILVFVKRMNYRSIFHEDGFSFGKLQVLPVAEEYSDPDILGKIYVYDDGFVKGLIHIDGDEIVELYVDSFFEGRGIGAELIEYAKENFGVSFLWVLEKNKRAIRFYENHGFHMSDTRKLQEGTPEYLVKLEL